MSRAPLNRLSAESLGVLMLSSLPEGEDAEVRNPYDAIALLCHACMLAVGFRLIGLGEDHRIEPPATNDNPQPLPTEWNASKSSDYSFRYAHSQSSLQYLIKVSRLGSKVVVNGLGLGDDKVHSLDSPVMEFTSESSFPFKAKSGSVDAEVKRRLQDLFISPGRIADFASLLKVNIIQKLAPGLQKEGYADTSAAANEEATGREQDTLRRDPLRDDRLPPPARPHPFNDPLAVRPLRPIPASDFPPPGFEDEYEFNRGPGRGGFGGGRVPIGERDLYPPGLGPSDPLRGGGYSPRGGLGGGGMHPTFDDPLFGGDGGGGGYDSRAPPGARYDPVGPGDGPPNLRGGPRFPGGGGFGLGRPPNPFGGFGGNDFI